MTALQLRGNRLSEIGELLKMLELNDNVAEVEKKCIGRGHEESIPTASPVPRIMATRRRRGACILISVGGSIMSQ